mmetsp:Transcript_19010/g.41416  ORF Transcript_19010/g.41416 Transcript_19010/m.41416 type:complete len:265 (+) Transcript_19010:2-796(+)
MKFFQLSLLTCLSSAVLLLPSTSHCYTGSPNRPAFTQTSSPKSTLDTGSTGTASSTGTSSTSDSTSNSKSRFFFATIVGDDDNEKGPRAADSTAKDEEVVVDWDWKQMARDVFASDQRPIVLFDGVCNLCNGGVNFAMDQDDTARLRFASLQSRVGQSLLLRSGRSPTDTSSIVYVTEEDAFYSSDAVSHICMELDAAPLRWFGRLGQLTPPWVREGVYQFVSENRYQFGENDSCRLDFDGTYTSRFVSDPAGVGGNSDMEQES